jgi:uncharacterized protein
MGDLPRCRLTTWADADRWADRLAGQIRTASAVPETIVALTRGGWVPSRLLSDRLGVKRLVSVRAQHWGVTATPDGKAKITEGLSGPVDGQKVLVVDDITDTGESLSLAASHVAEQRPARLETAACLHIAHSKFVPTYYAEEIPRSGWVWVVFPWNYWEDVAALATRALEFGRGVETVRETLKSRSGLEVPLKDLERVAEFVPIR